MTRTAYRPTLRDVPLVLAAHGSADPRFAEVMVALASMIVEQRPWLEVRIGYLEHGPPHLAEVSQPGGIVVPVLLTDGFHAHIDIPTQAAGAVIAAAVGPDHRLARVMASRLRESGWCGQTPVVLAAAGSADAQALDDARRAAADLASELGVAVTAGFIGSGEPRLSDLPAAAVASYLLAPGHFADALATGDASVVAPPLGADPLVAAIILDRYDSALVTPATLTAAGTTPDRPNRASVAR